MGFGIIVAISLYWSKPQELVLSLCNRSINSTQTSTLLANKVCIERSRYKCSAQLLNNTNNHSEPNDGITFLAKSALVGGGGLM